MKQLIQKYQVGGFIYNPEVSKKTGKLIFDKNGIRYDIWQASRELENSGSGLHYNDLYNSIPRQKYSNRFQPIIDFFKSLPEIKTTYSPSGFGMSNTKIKKNSNSNQKSPQKSIQKSTQGINFSRFQFKKLGGIIKASGGWRVGDPNKGEKGDQIYGTVKGQKVTFDVKDGEPIYWTWTTDNNGTHYTAHKFLMTDQDIAELNAIAKSVGRTSFFRDTNIKSKPYYYFNAQRTPARQVATNQPTTANQPVKQTVPSNQNFDLSENNPLVQEFLNKNGYVKSTPIDASKNGNIAETVKPEPETTKSEEQKQVTYSDILSQNTDTIKNRIFNSGWRGAFKDTLNQALMTPDYYNNGEGTQVFDFELPDGTVVNYDYLSGNGMLNKHGLLKAGAMRKLAKNFKQQGRNIAQQRYVGVGNQQVLPNAAPVTNIVDTYEPNYGIRMIGTTTPILGPDWNGMKNEVEKYQQKEPDITV